MAFPAARSPGAHRVHGSVIPAPRPAGSSSDEPHPPVVRGGLDQFGIRALAYQDDRTSGSRSGDQRETGSMRPFNPRRPFASPPTTSPRHGTTTPSSGPTITGGPPRSRQTTGQPLASDSAM